MNSCVFRFVLISFILLCCWLITSAPARLHGQMIAVINSLADDANAEPWDNPETPDVDESRDGVCRDLDDRCTLRAAIQEAWNMNNGLGVPIDITLNMSGTLALEAWGDLVLPSNSRLHGNNLTTITADSDRVILGLQDNTIVEGINFKQGLFLIDINGTGNVIAGNVMKDATLSCLAVTGNRNIVGRGNIIYNGGQSEIWIGGHNNVVRGNYIGLNANGDSVGGSQFGIQVFGDENIIGGIDPDDRNIISAHSISGVMVGAVISDYRTMIIGNYIGTDPTGTQGRANSYGVQVVSGRTTIGGSTVEERNIISGNKHGGIETRGDALDVRIIGNYIGLDISGLPLGNRDGIILSPGSFDCIVESNTISYNGNTGIHIWGDDRGPNPNPSWNHRIRGNKISHNYYHGIFIGGSASDIVIGSSLTQDFAPNIIDSNGTAPPSLIGSGVHIGGIFTGIARANTIRKNRFGQNADVGITVHPTFQDQILPPTIQNYADLGGGNAVVGAIHHRRDALIDVYAAERNPSGKYEGLRWVGSGTVIDSMVPTVISINSCNCTHLVATATDPSGNTSEFSDSLQVSGTTDVGTDRMALPAGWSLGDAYPNPFNPETKIQYAVSRRQHITLQIYDLLGREVATLVDEIQDPGFKSAIWNASGSTSGIYFYRLLAGQFSAVKKVALIR